jgi:hypothetical protein
MATPEKSQKNLEEISRWDIYLDYEEIEKRVRSVEPVFNEIKEILNLLKDIDEKRIRNKKVKGLIVKIKRLIESDNFKNFLDFLEMFLWCPYTEKAIFEHCDLVHAGYIGADCDEEDDNNEEDEDYEEEYYDDYEEDDYDDDEDDYEDDEDEDYEEYEDEDD